MIVEQDKYGKNEKVRAVEERLGNFPFDDNLVNDGVAKSLVGPRETEGSALYYGHWRSDLNQRHGFGMQIWPDGSKYVGYWENDLASGTGRLIHSEGDAYIGTCETYIQANGRTGWPPEKVDT